MPTFSDPQINIYTRDVENLTRFYTQTLGFTETFRVPTAGAPDHVEVRLGGLVLGFASVTAAKEHHSFDANRADGVVSRADWLAALTEATRKPDLARDIARLLDRGVSNPGEFITDLLVRAGVRLEVDPSGIPRLL